MENLLLSRINLNYLYLLLVNYDFPNEKHNLSFITDNNNINNTNDNINITVGDISQRIKDIMHRKEYENKSSVFNNINFIMKNEYLIISTNEISESLRHIDQDLDRVLHQTKYAIFDKDYLPIVYVEKSIKGSDLSYTKNSNSYIKSYVYDKLPEFDLNEFDKSSVKIVKNHIGSYVVLFFHNNKWNFFYNMNILELKYSNHPLLYEHIGSNINKFNKDLVYHIIIIDKRLRKLIVPYIITKEEDGRRSEYTHNNHIVLVKTTKKFTLEEIPIENKINDNEYLIHDCLVKDKRIYMSCMDELNMNIEELDIVNSNMKKLINRGYLVTINYGKYDSITINYETYTYKRLINMIPKGMSIHETYLKLYQQDKLSQFLQYISDTHIDIVKRINMSMSTLSREILDIYHMTRQKKNSQLYKLLPHTYKQLLHQLHGDYIAQKNDISDQSSLNIQNDNIYDDFKIKKKSPINTSSKVSISVDNVYTKLKTLDINVLRDLYKERDQLIENITNYHTNVNKYGNNQTNKLIKNILTIANDNGYDEDYSDIECNISNEYDSDDSDDDSLNNNHYVFKSPIKNCTDTKIQSRLLFLNYPI